MIAFGRRRVPVVLQTETAECGLACLAMVAAAHGLRTDLPTLRRQLPVSPHGVTLADLVRMAGSLQLAARALRAELDDLPRLRLPCVLHWDLNHFVVLVSVRRGIATLHDPARGLRRLPLSALSPHFTGVALELSPAPGFVPRAARERLPLRALVGPVAGLRRSLAQVFVLALALEFFVLLSPFLLQWVVDGVLVTGDRDLLLTLALGFALLVGLQAATAAARSWAVLVLSSSLGLQWGVNVFAHLMRLPLDWFGKRHAGDVWSRFGAVQEIRHTLTGNFVEAVLDGVMVVLTLALMAVYSGRLTALALGAVAIYALLRWSTYGALRQATEETLVHEAQQASHFLESLRGVQAIRLLGGAPERVARHASLAVDAVNADVQARRLELLLAAALRAVGGLERVAVVCVGALLVLDGRLSVGMLFAFLAFRETFALRVSALIDKGVALKMLRLQGERLGDIVSTPAEVDRPGLPPDAPPAPPLPAVPGLELRDVQFSYAPGQAPVLRGVNLRIEPGESVAVVGPSGCGKSTLLKIMLGLLRPDSGQVLVGGQPLDAVGLAAWRERLGVVMQDEPLFSGSIADNIAFFALQPDRPWLEHCARMAAVHDDIAALPMGYHTLIGDMGAALSGGQKQRILLARALYRRPGVLLLDEATSALDVERERQVNQALRGLAVTRIVVAHRPETVANATRVIALHDGRVAHDLRSVGAVAAGAVPAAAPPG